MSTIWNIIKGCGHAMLAYEFDNQEITFEDSLSALHNQKFIIEKRIEYLQKKIAANISDAISKKSDRQMAMYHLKMKRGYERQRAKMIGIMTVMNQLIDKISEAEFLKDIQKEMLTGKDVLDSLLKNIDLDKINDITESLQDNISKMDEAYDAMSMEPEDSGLEEELEALVKQDLGREQFPRANSDAVSENYSEFCKAVPG